MQPNPGETFNFAQHLIDINRSRGDKIAYIDEHESISYAQLADRIQRSAAALVAAGLRRQERVLLVMNDCCDWPVAFLGCLYAGIVPVAVNTLLPATDLGYVIAHSRAQAVLCSGSLTVALGQAFEHCGQTSELRQTWVSRPGGALTSGQNDFARLCRSESKQEHCADTHPDEPGFWLYSSGSTGRPKGTVHTHDNLLQTAQLYGKGILDLRESDVCFSAAKLFFAYGLGNALSFPLSVGATVVLNGGRATPEAVFERWRQHRVTVFFGAPTGYAAMLAHPALPDKAAVALRLCSSAGEALPRELGERFRARFGCDIVDGIGSTEMLHIYLSNRPGDVRYGTTGFAVPGYTIELRGEDAAPVADGEIGDLFVSGPSSALMYWNNREKSRDTFRGAWTKSGDKYLRNADGSYTYCGRSDDMLKVSGQYVSPFEVEATLIEHAAVLEAAVVGVKDEQGLTRVKAYVVCKPGQSVSADELQAFVKTRLTPFKYPRSIAFVSELPKTATGKIQRFRLRDAQAQ